MIVQFRRRINNAPNRKKDRIYTYTVETDFVPRSGDKVVTGFGAGLEVREVLVNICDGDQPIIVILEPDHTTFKQPDKFAERCAKVEAAGWTVLDD